MGAIERAAEAIHQLSNSDPWEREHPYLRREYRDDARAAFGSIDVDELAQVIERASDAWWNDLSGDGPSVGEYRAAAVKAWLVGEEA